MAWQRELMLNDTQARHCARMHDYLVEQIAAAGGWLSFETFMDSALYAPGLGYYSAGAQKLGAGGDFTTAPELSSLFGACVARQCAEILEALGGGSILEIGAGSGRLAEDVLRRLHTLERLPDAYWILEVSGDLRERQRRRLAQSLPDLIDRVHWLDGPPEHPFDGVMLANEVLDALPVTRFRWSAAGPEELGVVIAGQTPGAAAGDSVGTAAGAGGGGAGGGARVSAYGPELARFAWQGRPARSAVADACRRLNVAGGGWDEGYVSEYCPRLAAWSQSVTRALRSGAALWFDYGLPRSQYYLPERHDGTLLCHFQHRAQADPFLYPGLQDITAWVDFTALAEASREAGFALGGFTTQSYFLAGLKVDQEMQVMAADDANRFARLANEARQLMLPGEMGERFKAMAWLRGLDLPLSGFALQDLRHTL